MKKAVFSFFCALTAFQLHAAQDVSTVDNVKCPVTGNPVNDVDSYIHNGKEVNLCSKACAKQFARDPDNYISIAENEEMD